MKPKFQESKLQIQCVRWFSLQYPHMRMLLYHPKNEGHAGGRTQGAIAKAEGVVAGVADLMLQVPASGYNCLAIEMKTPKGTQRKEQKLFELYISAAGGRYIIVRSFEQFCEEVTNYLAHIEKNIDNSLRSLFRGQQQAEIEQARQQLRKVIAAAG